DLGFAKLVEERKVGNDKMVFIEGCPNPKAVSILLRGANDMILDEAERSLNDALHVLRNVLRKPMIVPGGGATEVELALHLRRFAESLGGREQLAVEAFADALEEIPMVLAESAGLDALQTLMDLRKMHSEGKIRAGVDVIEGKVVDDMIAVNVIEPVLVKEQVLKSATEAATTILKIDDVVAASPKTESKKGKGGKKDKEED
ncbi:MAG: TCP-1/cpn60 chaperonin family protein, partial [Thermoproteota archaeon]